MTVVQLRHLVTTAKKKSLLGSSFCVCVCVCKCIMDAHHGCGEGQTLADVSQFSASLVGVKTRPDLLPALIPAPARERRGSPTY